MKIIRKLTRAAAAGAMAPGVAGTTAASAGTSTTSRWFWHRRSNASWKGHRVSYFEHA